MTPRDAQLNKQDAMIMKESQTLQGCYKDLLKEKEAWMSHAQSSAPPDPSHMRYWETQDKKMEEIKEMMTSMAHDFKHVGAKLRNVEGSVLQLATKQTEIETVMETWNDDNSLEPCEEDPYIEEEEEEYDSDDWSGWDGKTRNEDESAPDGAADGKETTRRTRIDDQPEEEEEEDEEGQGENILG